VNHRIFGQSIRDVSLDHTFNIAAFQTEFATDDHRENLEVIRSRLEWSDAHDVKLACFPECFLTGYFTQINEAFPVALSLGSRMFSNILKQLEMFDATVVLGLIERDQDALYNTAIVISRGHVLGKYRKTHPNESCFSPGDEYPVFDVPRLRFGINICFDANFPDAAARVAQAGAQVIVYPLNNALSEEVAVRWRAKSGENLAMRARETKCYVVSADVVGRNDSKMSYGCTQIVSPEGQVMSAVSELEMGVAFAEIPYSRLAP
jgi:5-aminopentanamidase